MEFKFIIGLIIMCTVVFAIGCRSQVISDKGDNIYTYTATPKDNYSYAKFSIWCPDDIETFRGVLYLGPGYEDSSISMINRKEWQDLARENGFVLLASHIKSRTELDTRIPYWQAEYGTGQALLDALKYFAKEAKHPEIEHAPLAMWGFSAGGQFNYQFACWKPERVITFVAIKGGYYFAEANSEVLKTPALFITGDYDLQRRKDAVDQLFRINIYDEPLWCLANEPKSGHDLGQTDDLALPWLREVIKQRLPEESSEIDKSVVLKDINQSLAWLGDRTDGYIAAISGYEKDRYNSSWFPSENLARIWKSFHLTDNKF